MSDYIHWREGLFLQPHHLQQFQRGVHHRIEQVARLGGPFPHGVIDMDLAEDELENFQLRFRKLHVLLPSGTLLRFPEEADLPVLNIKEAFTSGKETLLIYLALPLWFEEGVASILGDGVAWRGRWQVDGLACWPLRELREEELSDEHLAELLALRASDACSVRDNVLVHFVGWAIVFDLYRETGALDWRAWYERFDHGAPVQDARRRLAASLAAGTVDAWLAHLSDPDPGRRVAAAKGTWKLRSLPAFERLVEALEAETDEEARVALAVNALAAAGEVSAPWGTRRRLDRAVQVVLREARLADPDEERALRELERAYRRFDGQQAQRALEGLARFWEE